MMKSEHLSVSTDTSMHASQLSEQTDIAVHHKKIDFISWNIPLQKLNSIEYAKIAIFISIFSN